MARGTQRRPLRRGALPDAIVLDSGALGAAAQDDARVRAELTMAKQVGVPVHVSSVILAECLRGHQRDTRIHAIIAGAEQDHFGQDRLPQRTSQIAALGCILDNENTLRCGNLPDCSQKILRSPSRFAVEAVVTRRK
ncbi:MAG: hypothetical protein ACYCST_03495 [Acidimicrobiales bacterium]